MQCENCTRPAAYQVRAYRFCLPCARRFLGYTPEDACKLPNQAEQEDEIRALRATVKALISDAGLWMCEGCGALFPHTRGDEDVTRCSKCVEVEALVARVKQLDSARAAAQSAADRANKVVYVLQDYRYQLPGAVRAALEDWEEGK